MAYCGSTRKGLICLQKSDLCIYVVSNPGRPTAGQSAPAARTKTVSIAPWRRRCSQGSQVRWSSSIGPPARSRAKRPERLEALLLVAALATLILWLLGLAAPERQWNRHFQAKTERRQRVLSTVFLGQEMWRNHRFRVTRSELT